MAWGYYDTRDEKDKADDDRASISKTSSTISQNAKLNAKSVQLNTSRTIASTGSGAEDGFSLGSILRWLLIILMILAIVVFFGGQILQISKSGDE